MSLRFGTDGVRGVANAELTPELALGLGRAAARVLTSPTWLVGRDTRRSGPLLGAALAAGLASEGADVVDLGVLPTPAVAHLAAVDGVAAAMISASHNHFADNGIKLFSAGGRKLRDDTEAALEAELDRLVTESDGGRRPVGVAVGRLSADPGRWRAWAAHLGRDVLEGRRLDRLKVVVDCAHGAVSEAAPAVLSELVGELVVLNAAPDGSNINAGCGSTHPDGLARAVVEHGADVGLAFDGDADRVLAVDAAGRLVDGDQIIAVCAVDLHERGRLAANTVVVTVMTNLGFRLAMEERDITVVETRVGDRYVLEALEDGGLSLGGEQSGHVIFPALAATGDGLLTGLVLLDVVARSGRSLADLAGVVTRLPQVLVNVEVRGGAPALMAAIADDVRAAEQALGRAGRVLIRPSGTEPVVRVMVEAPTLDEARTVADDLAVALERAGG